MTKATPEPDEGHPDGPTSAGGALDAVVGRSPQTQTPDLTVRVRLLQALVLLAVLAGVACLLLNLVADAPAWVGAAGAVAVSTAYAAMLGFRTGRSGTAYGATTLLLGLAAVLIDPLVSGDQGFLAAGAAVLTAVVSAVLAVLITVPAVRYPQAVREVLIAYLVADVGALAVIGFAPEVKLARFEYATLALTLVAALAVIYRLGAGLHGIGKRGLIAVVIGTLVLVAIIAYVEALRAWGMQSAVRELTDAADRFAREARAVPPPIQALLGVPALVWGVHMRARRQQGWWVLSFGVLATASAASSVVLPRSIGDAALGQVYALVIGLLIGFLVVWVDTALSTSGGRRGRRAEVREAVRPEPPRRAPLL